MDHRVQVCMNCHTGSQIGAQSAEPRLQQDTMTQRLLSSSKHRCAGKTTALVEAVLQEVKRGNRVLACAASNVAASPACYYDCSSSREQRRPPHGTVIAGRSGGIPVLRFVHRRSSMT